jgi:hypothetical protein
VWEMLESCSICCMLIHYKLILNSSGRQQDITLNINISLMRSWDSTVSIATGNGLDDGLEFESW